MIWQLKLTANHQQSGEFCLSLSQGKRNHLLRRWFGPLAQHLFQQPVCSREKTPATIDQDINIDKQMAQHLLIQASFFHQRCLQQYQIQNHLKQQCQHYSHELCELLLFIRMSSQHPCQKTLQLFVDCQMPWCTDIEAEINTLLDARLIQKIKYKDLIFYDKNPYPHDHLLNLKTSQLKDFNSHDTKINHQELLICQSP